MLSMLLLCETIFAKTRIEISIGGISGSTCESSRETVITTGSLALIIVTVLPEPRPAKLPFQGFPETKPSWLTLEVGYVQENERLFTASQELLGLLNPTYFLNEAQLVYNEAWKQGDDLKEIAKQPDYCFLIEIPAALAGAIVCARASLIDPPYGPLVENKYEDILRPLIDSVKILAPCSDADVSRALASQIKFSRFSGNFERAVQLADSLIDTGRRVGLQDALTSAILAKNYQAALRFLDLAYETNGTVVPRQGGALRSVDQEKRAYRERREIILRQIAEQAQQQR
jgi:hypothetical protein